MGVCWQVFSKLRQGDGVEEEALFEAINSIQVTVEEFEESKSIQLMAQEKATIFKLFI